MSKFKVGDKVVCIDRSHTWYPKDYYIVEEVIEAVDKLQLKGFRGTHYAGHFKLYKDKEMQEFDKIKLTTGMRVVHKNGRVGIVLKDIGVIAYESGFNKIKDFDVDGYHLLDGVAEEWKLIKVYKGFGMHENILDHSCLGDLIWERKEETEQQKRIRELKETIDNASKQIEELMKEVK